MPTTTPRRPRTLTTVSATFCERVFREQALGRTVRHRLTDRTVVTAVVESHRGGYLVARVDSGEHEGRTVRLDSRVTFTD